MNNLLRYHHAKRYADYSSENTIGGRDGIVGFLSSTPVSKPNQVPKISALYILNHNPCQVR